MFSVVNPRNENINAPADGQRNRTGENDERIAEAFELRRQHQVNQHCREQEDAEELAAFDAKLARFTGVVDGESLRQNFLRFRSPGRLAPGRAERPAGSRPEFAPH